MSIFDIPDQKAPFLNPFVVALAFGIPVSVAWFLAAMETGILVSIITTVLGCLCGFGARVSARGWHPAGAAILATSILIILTISSITITVIASEAGQSVPATLVGIITQGSFVEFSNACVIVAGKSFIRYPIALYVAYRVSDAS